LTSGGAFHIPQDKAGEVIGWKPVVTMKEGVTRLLAWLEQQKK
jgi:UDP-glucose 4-epimerase